MIKDVNYSGLATNLSPYSSPDGSLSLAFNCINEDGALYPIFEPKVLFPLSDSQTCLYVHSVDSKRHFIILDTNQSYEQPVQLLYVIEDDAVLYHFEHTPLFSKVHSISSVGNVLTVLSDLGISYFLWNGNSYDYVGEHMPELSLKFSLSPIQAFVSDTFRYAPEDGIAYDHYFTARSGLLNCEKAAVNQLFDKISESQYFTFPFFLRYAYRLFDGSVTMQSAPILLISSLNCITINIGWENKNNKNGGGFTASAANIRAIAIPYSIACSIIDSASRLENWKDIISSIDFFMSPQFYTNDVNAEWSNANVVEGEVPRRNIAPDISGNSNFYLIKSISIDELLSGLKDSPTFEIKPDFSITNDNIVVRESLPDDFNSHNTLLPKIQHIFNSRLNVAMIREKFFCGYSPASLFSYTELTKNVEASYNVFIKSNFGEFTLSAPNPQTIQVDDSYDIIWFFYPDFRAKYVVFHIKEYNDAGDVIYDEYRKYSLKPHAILNGSYFSLFEDTANGNKIQRPLPDFSRADNNSAAEIVGEPSVSDVDFVVKANYVYTSEVNNPFAFNQFGINAIGSGEIIGIASASKALSQGQFGQFPLYAFCTDGVWALEPSANGAFSTKQAVSRDVCTNLASITQLDCAVAFATARGIMLLQGSQCECLSNDLGTQRSFSAYDLGEEYLDSLLKESGINLTCDEINIIPFPEFAKNCQIVFDYINQRIIIFSTQALYCYAFSLKSKLWGMFFANDIKNRINSYTDALAMKGNNVVDFSRPETDCQKVLVVTNPLNLSAPDCLKAIRTVAQRGNFKQQNIKQILYGSRDLIHWHAISSSTNEFIRGWGGTPYKHFRIAFSANLSRGESISGSQILFEQRYTNKLR